MQAVRYNKKHCIKRPLLPVMKNSTSRPLSPHLQVYRLPLTAVLSILHRITGVILTLGFVLLVATVVALATDAALYERIAGWFGHWLGCTALVACSAALFLHLSNGVRHLIWDAGWGFELKTVDISAFITIAATVLLTITTWAIAWR